MQGASNCRVNRDGALEGDDCRNALRDIPYLDVRLGLDRNRLAQGFDTDRTFGRSDLQCLQIQETF